MSELVTVGALAEELGVRVQVINKWVTHEGLNAAEGVKPRSISREVFDAWYAQREQKTKAVKAERKEKSVERAAQRAAGIVPPRNSTVKYLSQQERKVLAWSRGEGRGWALAAPDKPEQPFLDDYIELVNQSGNVHGTTERHLLREAKEGKLFFMDPCEVVAFLAGQLLAAKEQDQSEPLAEAINALGIAAANLDRWRAARHGISSTELDEVIADGAKRQPVYEDGGDVSGGGDE